MNMAVGRLVQSRITDWLPLLGAYIVANNQMTEAKHGFVLYNITDAIVATDVSAWFTRWLLSYPIAYVATVITLKLDRKPVLVAPRMMALALGTIAMVLLLVLAVLTRDFWAFANAFSMIASIVVRQSIIRQLRVSIDRAIESFWHTPGDPVKVFLTLPNGKAVTIFAPRLVVVNCILTDAKPVHATLYFISRAVGWAAFGTHVVTLGIAGLVNQLSCVLLLICSTVLVAHHIGDDPYSIGAKLSLDVQRGDPTWTRALAYARLALDETEEETMVRWNLFPQRSNRVWWDRYRLKAAIYIRQTGSQNEERSVVQQSAARQSIQRQEPTAAVLRPHEISPSSPRVHQACQSTQMNASCPMPTGVKAWTEHRQMPRIAPESP